MGPFLLFLCPGLYFHAAKVCFVNRSLVVCDASKQGGARRCPTFPVSVKVKRRESPQLLAADSKIHSAPLADLLHELRFQITCFSLACDVETG